MVSQSFKRGSGVGHNLCGGGVAHALVDEVLEGKLGAVGEGSVEVGRFEERAILVVFTEVFAHLFE